MALDFLRYASCPFFFLAITAKLVLYERVRLGGRLAGFFRNSKICVVIYHKIGTKESGWAASWQSSIRQHVLSQLVLSKAASQRISLKESGWADSGPAFQKQQVRSKATSCCSLLHTSAYVSIYVSIRQNTSAYVSIRQQTSEYLRL